MKTLYATVLLAALTLPLAAQHLTNDGAQITVASGATLFVSGAVNNKAGGTFTNNGTVEVQGNFTNAGTISGSTGKVVISGTTDQTLTAGGATLYQLQVNKPGGSTSLLVADDLTVSNLLTLTSGMVKTTGTATILIPTTGSVTGEATGRYVQGKLQVQRNSTGSTDFGNGAIIDLTSLGTVTVLRTAGLQTANVSYGQSPVNAARKGIDRIWTITSSAAPNGAVPITFSWLPENDNGILDFATMQGWRAAGTGTWENVGTPGPATIDPATSTRSFAFTTTSLGSLTLSNASNPLPVELTEFTAERRENHARLRWVTASEKDNDYFDVESSIDGRTFSRIGTVKGRGTTSQRSTYELLDARIARYGADVIYYRLRQVDKDGKASHSPLRTVTVPAESELMIQAFPNPFGKHLTIRIRSVVASPVNLGVHDALGKRVFSKAAELTAGTNELALDELQQLPRGVYFLTVRTAGEQRVLKLTRE
ncbi:T9SS type A sorting domain-containing protein [Hymenobacter sp. BT175]|uniref:T9SS type A sorting domain-containing protein n=1 Tax=Hymenobacter translucens TaxID=2886507 RepID=UPI001D0ED518|nr:T9SS type A sorting domain-containing protein [Hymenobacter translucens]MCC2545698.1 T9SS type A sorting domain-containing protein [Hymenobacter translucens]